MLALFRRHQKIILTVVTVMVITSFSFFGAFRAFQPVARVSDKVVGKWIDGKACYERELQKIIRFLETDFTDLWIVENRGYANILNDGIVRSEFFQTGTIELFADAYFPLFEEEFKEKVALHKKFRPYIHPQRVLGMEALWKQVFPLLYENYHKFLKEEDARKQFSHLVALFLNQGLLPPYSVREMLFYQERQYRGRLPEDSAIRSADFSLFYAKSLSDWFGKKCARLLAQFIYNGALYAKEKGYKVGYEEAKVSLQLMARKHFERMHSGQKVEKGEFEQFYQKQLSLLGMQERDVVLLWQKMLYFRKLMQDIGGGVFADSALYREFHNYASQELAVTLYELPPHLRFKHEDDLYKWSLYVEAVTGKKGVEPPTSFLPIETIATKNPELLEKKFLVRIAKVDTKELSLEVPLRKVWDWELEESHFALLQEKFPLLGNSTQQELSSFLNTLSVEERQKIDAFVRRKIMEENPVWVEESLSKAAFSPPQIISIPRSGNALLFLRLKDREGLLSSLESDDERLSYYTEDGEHFYRFQVLDRAKDFTIIPFEDAEKRGILHALLEKRKGKLSYEGDFDKVFVPFMKEMRQRIVQGEVDFTETPSLQGELQQIPEPLPITESWRPVKREIKVERKNRNPLFNEEIFTLEPNSWSDVLVEKEEGPFFYQVHEAEALQEPLIKSMEEASSLLGKEAKEHLLRKIIQRIADKATLSIQAIEDDGS